MSRKTKNEIQVGDLIEMMLFGEKIACVVTSTANGEIKVRRVSGPQFVVSLKEISPIE